MTMLSLLETIHAWIKEEKISISKERLRNLLVTHPDYPSLLAITDTLEELGLDYEAFESNKKNLDEIRCPFLAHYWSQEFTLINSARMSEWGSNETAKMNFLESWDGIGIILLPINSWRAKKKWREILGEGLTRYQKIISGMAVLVAFPVIFYLNNYLSAISFIDSLLCIPGILISTAIALHEFGQETIIAERVCGFKALDCNTVLGSVYNRLLWIKLSDASMVFFSGLWLLFLGNGIYSQNNALPLSLPCLAIPICVYSIFVQWKIEKAWCRLCLLIIGVIILMNLMSLTFWIYGKPNLNFAFKINILYAALTFSMFTALWYYMRMLIQKLANHEELVIENLSWKRDPSVFWNQLQKERKTDNKTWEEDLILGNPHAPIQFLVVNNPACGPCEKVHQSVHKLVEKYYDMVSVTIRFNITDADNANDKKNQIVSRIVNRHFLFNMNKGGLAESPIKDYLFLWYKYKDIKQFEKHVPVEHESYLKAILRKHQDWTSDSHIDSTPAIFVNGNRLPKLYKIEDLDLLITNLYYYLTESTANHTFYNLA